MNADLTSAATSFRPTLTWQSSLFMVGSSLFAVGTAIGALVDGGAWVANLLCFIGAWFFTSAGLIQVYLSRPARGSAGTSQRRSGLFRAEWLAAVVQSAGTILFNVSTAAALFAASARSEREFVWSPDAGGSIAFLVSAVFVFAAYPRGRRAWDPSKTDWWSTVINMLGCIAFGVSALGSFVLLDGSDASAAMANWGTFVGAVCFFVAALVVLPKLNSR